MVNEQKLKLHIFYVKSSTLMRREEYLRLTHRLEDQPYPDKFDFQRSYQKVATVQISRESKFPETPREVCEKVFAAFNEYASNPLSYEYNPRFLAEIHKITLIDSLEGQEEILKAGVGHTSMSVGDIIVVQAEFTVTVWYYDMEGWIQLHISRDAVKDYIK